jgi:hypothetical protein
MRMMTRHSWPSQQTSGGSIWLGCKMERAPGAVPKANPGLCWDALAMPVIHDRTGAAGCDSRITPRIGHGVGRHLLNHWLCFFVRR